MISTFETISKNVLDLNSGTKLGVVGNIKLQKNKVSHLIVLSENNDDFLSVPTQNIYKLGDDAVTLKSLDAIEQSEHSNAPKILGNLIVSQEGKNEDSLIDITFNEKSFCVESFIAEKRKYKLNEIDTIVDGFIILKGKLKLLKQSVSSFNKLETKKEDIHSGSLKFDPKIILGEMKFANSEEINNEVKKEEFSSPPSKLVGDYGFLIGRRLTQSLIKDGKAVLSVGEVLNLNKLHIAIEMGQISFIIKNNTLA